MVRAGTKCVCSMCCCISANPYRSLTCRFGQRTQHEAKGKQKTTQAGQTETKRETRNPYLLGYVVLDVCSRTTITTASYFQHAQLVTHRQRQREASNTIQPTGQPNSHTYLFGSAESGSRCSAAAPQSPRSRPRTCRTRSWPHIDKGKQHRTTNWEKGWRRAQLQDQVVATQTSSRTCLVLQKAVLDALLQLHNVPDDGLVLAVRIVGHEVEDPVGGLPGEGVRLPAHLERRRNLVCARECVLV